MVPEVISPYLWYLDKDKVDLERDKKRIMLNVLNYGSREAVSWLFSHYSLEDIKDVFINWAAKGELSKKSLNYWSIIFGIDKNSLVKTRF